MRRTITILLAAAGLALAGCDASDNYFQAGAEVDEGAFGNPTMNNTLIMTGQKSAVADLTERFSTEVNPMVNFDFDSAILDEQAKTILRQQATWIRQFPEIRFRVYGHTDLVGSASYNKALGLRRAQAVVAYLGTQGISRSRLEAIASFGKTQPLIVTQGRERRNRRTVTQVSGFVENHPGLLDGKYAHVVYREYVRSAVPPTTLGGSEFLATETQ